MPNREHGQRQLQPLPLPGLVETPLVSVLVANYNYEAFVGHAIESVLAQSYSDLEVIVCDDASTDDSRAVIQSLAERDDRVKLVAQETNGGMAAATNMAYAASAGQVLCLLDSDDYFHPEKVSTIVQQFHHEPRTGLIVHPLMVVDTDGREVQQIPFLTHFEHGWIADRVIRRGGRWRDMPTTALSFRRELAKYVFPIPEAEFQRAADGFTFTLLPLLTEVSAVTQPLAMYRVHGSNDHLALGFDERVADAEKAFIEVQNRMVNERLESLLGVPRILRLEWHVGHQQRAFVGKLLGSTARWELFRSYARFVRLLARDDLYRRTHKLAIGVVYGIATISPTPVRKRWLGLALGHHRFKQSIRSAMSWITSLPGRVIVSRTFRRDGSTTPAKEKLS